MQLLLDSTWILAILLIAIRLGPLFIGAPGFGSLRIPVMARGLITLGFAATLFAGLNTSQLTIPSTPGALMLIALSELLIGATLAFGLLAAFAAFQFGGRVIDLQIGFGIANVFDPLTRSQKPLLGMALELTALMVFFAIDGHHLILRGVAFSLEIIPPGTPFFNIPIAAIVAQFGAMFSFGIAVVAPVVFVLFLLDVGLATISRTMPQVNIFFVSIPLKAFVGLTVLAISINYMGPLMRKIFESAFEYWQVALR